MCALFVCVNVIYFMCMCLSVCVRDCISLPLFLRACDGGIYICVCESVIYVVSVIYFCVHMIEVYIFVCICVWVYDCGYICVHVCYT